MIEYFEEESSRVVLHAYDKMKPTAALVQHGDSRLAYFADVNFGYRTITDRNKLYRNPVRHRSYMPSDIVKQLPQV